MEEVSDIEAVRRFRLGREGVETDGAGRDPDPDLLGRALVTRAARWTLDRTLEETILMVQRRDASATPL
ncbi:MAG: hypothetical protein ABSH47_27205 [Bryobacteraceae bacterium]